MTCIVCNKDFSGIPKICPDCIALIKKGAEQGRDLFQSQLGRCYLEGDGVPQDDKQAVYWLKKSAEQGHAFAQSLLGTCYYQGRGVLQDQAKAIYWLEKAEEQNLKSSSIQFLIGSYYFNTLKNKDKAIPWLKQSAEQDYAPAQYGLCLCYFFDAPEEHKKEAIHWCTKSAENGNIQAQAFLGNCYLIGMGVLKDTEKAIHWLTKSEEYDLAQLLLGQCYYYGDGVPKDKKQAVYWYKKSAEQGNSYAQFLLAGCYSFDDGIQKDEEQADYWYKKSTNRKHTVSSKPLKLDISHEAETNKNNDLEFILLNLKNEKTWQETLMQRIWDSGKKESEVYRKSDISKQLFSKIRSDRNYSAKKETVLALAIGLELDIKEAEIFLEEAGYAFSRKNAIDIVVRDFISKKQYDISKINEVLYSKNLQSIGNSKNAN